MMGFGMGGFGSVLLLVVVGFIVWYFVKERDARQPSGGGERRGDDAAMTILRERYARGEIDKEEYDVRRRELARQD